MKLIPLADGYLVVTTEEDIYMSAWLPEEGEIRKPYLSDDEKSLYLPKGTALFDSLDGKTQFSFWWTGTQVISLETGLPYKLETN